MMNFNDQLLLTAVLTAPSWDERERAIRTALQSTAAAQRQDALEHVVNALGEFARVMTLAAQDNGGELDEFVRALISHCNMALDAANVDIDAELATLETDDGDLT